MSWTHSLEQQSVASHVNFDVSGVALRSMIWNAIRTGQSVHRASYRGKPQKPIEDLYTFVKEELKLRLLVASGMEDADNNSLYFMSKDTVVRVHRHDEAQNAETDINTTNEELFAKYQAFFSEAIKRNDRSGGVVFALVREREQLQLKSLGIAGKPLQRANYAETALEGIDHVVDDLSRESPTGRLSIFSGPPGTGKTFLIRSLLTVERCVFLLVPSNYIALISGPDFLPVLYNAHEQMKGPIVLILEDGDEAIAKREADNMSAVSALLNLGDGIIGTLLDIRVVLTTNIKKPEIDPAVMRPGRINRYVEIGPLPYSRACELFNSLCPDRSEILGEPRAYTLAEIYTKAADKGWKPPAQDKAPLGFQSHTVPPGAYAKQSKE